MKAALISATSLAALLAFEVGLDVAIDAQPAHAAATFSVKSSILNFGYVLLNTAGGTSSVLTDTITNLRNGPNTVTIPAVGPHPFSVAGGNVSLASTLATSPYQFTFVPTITGTPSAVVTLTANHTSTSMVSVTLTGQAVAPVQSTSQSAATTVTTNQSGTTVRIGTTATIAALTVANIGNGDLYSNTSLAAQLQTSIGVPGGSVFKGSASSFTLNDKSYTGGGSTITQSVFQYQYAPTAHATDSSTVNLNFANGSSAANNASQTASVVLTGRGVGPTFESTISTTAITGTSLSYSNSTAVGSTVVNTGQTISIASNKAHVTSTVTMTISNATTDGNLGTLTNLTLENFTLGSCAVSAVADGCISDGFSVIGFTAGAITAGNSVDVTLDFVGGSTGYYDADLSFTTDQGAAYGATGATFTYFLVANIPEPATVITFGMGLAGLGWVRRRRATRRSVGGANMAAA